MSSDLVMREGRSLGLPHVHLPEVTSTNDALRRLADGGAPEGAAVTTDFQTAGRGRFGRRWTSDAGQNLLVSVLLRPHMSAERVGILSLLSAVAVAEAVDDVASLHATVKWPNDVLIGDKKCCGILLESSWTGSSPVPDYVMAGIGINVNQDQFGQEMRARATSLRLETGRLIARQAVLDALMDRLSAGYHLLLETDTDSLRSKYVERLEGVGTEVRLCYAETGPTFSGVIEGITDRGGLVVRLRDGSYKTVLAGEITTQGAVSLDIDDLRD